MATYRYFCNKCKNITSFTPEDSSNPVCCGLVMQPYNIPIHTPMVVKVSGREQVLASLNSRNDGIGNKPHIKQAMWQGLHQRDPVVGRGFG